eukprot:gene33515-41361_t
MIDKTFESLQRAVADVHDGATVMIGGFGNAGMPSALIDALIEQGARDLTIVNNNAGNGETGLAALLKAGRVRKIICSFPRQADSHHFDALYRAGRIELELTPQGNLAMRFYDQVFILHRALVLFAPMPLFPTDDPLLRNADFRRYWFSSILTSFGAQISTLAIPLGMASVLSAAAALSTAEWPACSVLLLHATPGQMGIIIA